MPIDPDYAPGDAAPETGIYELLTALTVLAARAGLDVHMQIERAAA